MGRNAMYRASVPVQYSYTPTPPMGCTACIGPRCLYKGTLYLTLLNMLGMNIKVTIFMFHILVRYEESSHPTSHP